MTIEMKPGGQATVSRPTSNASVVKPSSDVRTGRARWARS